MYTIQFNIEHSIGDLDHWLIISCSSMGNIAMNNALIANKEISYTCNFHQFSFPQSNTTALQW